MYMILFCLGKLRVIDIICIDIAEEMSNNYDNNS